VVDGRIGGGEINVEKIVDVYWAGQRLAKLTVADQKGSEKEQDEVKELIGPRRSEVFSSLGLTKGRSWIWTCSGRQGKLS